MNTDKYSQGHTKVRYRSLQSLKLVVNQSKKECKTRLNQKELRFRGRLNVEIKKRYNNIIYFGNCISIQDKITSIERINHRILKADTTPIVREPFELIQMLKNHENEQLDVAYQIRLLKLIVFLIQRPTDQN